MRRQKDRRTKFARRVTARNVEQFEIEQARVVEESIVASSCSSLPVGLGGQGGGFSICSHGELTFVAYYADDDSLHLAVRERRGGSWDRVRLQEFADWDSHKNISMAIDRDGYIHVSGNMHCDPLVYYRSERALDIHSMRRHGLMIGENENQVTYPAFIKSPSEDLYFLYRDGISGAATYLVNLYDSENKEWKRQSGRPMIDGRGVSSPYIQGPTVGPDGYFHLCWVWRDSSNVITTHTLCYAKSRDFKTWWSSRGEELGETLTPFNAEVVDPVPCGGGLINNNHFISFDHLGQVVITYQKFDENGQTQLYAARPSVAGWELRRLTNWSHRWEFKGEGSLEYLLRFGPLERGSDKRLVIHYQHWKLGAGILLVDGESLEVVADIRGVCSIPRTLRESATSLGKVLRVASDAAGGRAEGRLRNVLCWFANSESRDEKQGDERFSGAPLRLVSITAPAVVCSRNIQEHRPAMQENLVALRRRQGRLKALVSFRSAEQARSKALARKIAGFSQSAALRNDFSLLTQFLGLQERVGRAAQESVRMRNALLAVIEELEKARARNEELTHEVQVMKGALEERKNVERELEKEKLERAAQHDRLKDIHLSMEELKKQLRKSQEELAILSRLYVEEQRKADQEAVKARALVQAFERSVAKANELEVERQQVIKEMKRLQKSLDAVMNSTSWRATSWLRWLSRKIGR